MFYLFTFISIFSAIAMVFCTNPINSVLFLISVFISTSMIFLLLNIEFIALLFIIIYVGAIAVLFLFIVMIINIKKIEQDNTIYIFTGFLFFFIILSEVILSYNEISFNFFPLVNYTYSYSDYYNILDESNRFLFVKKAGIILFSIKIYWPLYSALILLIATIGAIYLTNDKKGFSMKQQFNQLSRKNTIYNVNIY